MITGLTLDTIHEYISEADPAKALIAAGEPADPTIFKLRTLDSRVMGHLRDMATRLKVKPGAKPTDEVETEVAMNEVAYQTVLFGLEGAAPFVDQAGEQIIWKTTKRNLRGKSYDIVADEVVSRLPLGVISELSTELRKINNLGEEEGNE